MKAVYWLEYSLLSRLRSFTVHTIAYYGVVEDSEILFHYCLLPMHCNAL